MSNRNAEFHFHAKYLVVCDETDVIPTLCRMLRRKQDGLVVHEKMLEMLHEHVKGVKQLSLFDPLGTKSRMDTYREVNVRLNNYRRMMASPRR